VEANKVDRLVDGLRPWESRGVELVRTMGENGVIAKMVITREEPDDVRMKLCASWALRVSSMQSFVDVVQRFGKPDDCVIKICCVGGFISAVFGFDKDSLPNGERNIVELKVGFHPDFVAWYSVLGKPRDAKAFLKFLNERIDDIAPEQAEKLLAGYKSISTSIAVQRDFSLDDERGLYKGFSFTSKTGSKEPGRLMSSFDVKLPVLVNGSDDSRVFRVKIDVDEPDSPDQPAMFIMRCREMTDHKEYWATYQIGVVLRDELSGYLVLDC
jgi:hypothetical protein